MIRVSVFLLFSFLVHLSCGSRDQVNQSKKQEIAEIPTTPIQDRQLINKLIDSALSLGNERAYGTVSTYYLLERQEQDFFYNAFTMANKHNSVLAHFHVYLIFAMSSPHGKQKTIMSLDEKTKNLAMYYLLKSYEMGGDDAKHEIVEIFGKNSEIPKSSFYLQKICTE